MKYLSVFLIYIIAVTGCPQIKMESIEKVNFPDNGKYFHPKFDASGEKLLVTSENYKGLRIFDTGTKVLTKVTDGEGAGYAPAFSPDNDKILFLENRYIQNRRFSELQTYSIREGTTEILEPAARTVTPPMVAGNRILYKADGQLKSASFDAGRTSPGGDRICAGIEDQKLVLYKAGESRILSPYQDESYIWPSVSPDGTRILAFAMGKGAFVCDEAGSVLKELGMIEAPVWAGNDYIAGMVTRDDGHQIIESSVVMMKIETGEQHKVSPEGMIAMNPTVAEKTAKMAFHTLEGDVYIVKYQIKR